MYYHIVSNLEKRFASLQDAINAYAGQTLTPTVPDSKLEDENYITPRLCVCGWLPDCFTAIGLEDRMRRCIAANNDADFYTTDFKEVYPVLLLEFPDCVQTYKPSDADVPDVDLTHEEWILREIIPSKVTVKWLAPDSLLFRNPPESPDVLQATSCKFVTDITAKDHPWLNGRGHILHSKAMESEFEDYSALPIGRYLGNLKTIKSTIKQIENIMAWKDISGTHQIKIASDPIPGKDFDKPTHLEIICQGGNRQYPELYMQLVQDNDIMAISKSANDLTELLRNGVEYRRHIYRVRLWTIDTEDATAQMPPNKNAPTEIPEDLPIDQYAITDAETLAKMEHQ